MARNGIGLALSLVNKFAGSDVVDKLKIRKPAEKIAYASTRAGFQLASSASQGLQQVKSLIPNPFSGTKPEKALFDLTLSEEQQLIRDSLQRYAKDEIRPLADEANDTPSIINSGAQRIDKSFAELGIIEYAIPEKFGGMAQEESPLNSVLIAEDLAYGDMGIALSLLSNFSVANLLYKWGRASQQRDYLPKLIGASPLIATIAINEPTPLFSPYYMQTQAIPTDGGYRLIGTKSLVTQGMNANVLVVAASLPDGSSRLFFVESNTEGLSRRPEPAMGLKAAATASIKLDDVFVAHKACIGSDEFCWQTFLDLNSIMWCGMALGTSQAMLEYVTQYCNERIAFGEPISHRQSVAFIIADMATEIEAMRLLTLRAAAKANQGLGFQREAYLAKVLCSEKATKIATDGVQLLGGHGFTKEHPVERWYRDLVAITLQHNTLHA